MSIKSFFTNTCETRELHRDPGLRSNYYRNKVSQIVEALTEIANEQGLQVRNYDAVHKEMYLIGNGYEVIVTLTDVNPIECAVDFKVNFFSAFGFGRPRNKVVLFYSLLKKKLNFKGVALHP